MAKSISINLRRIRKMKSLTQQELADMVGISRNAYRSIETGDSDPRSATFGAIALALNISVFDLTAEVPNLETLRFRSLESLSARERAEREQIAADVAIWLKDFEELEETLNNRREYLFSNKNYSETSPQKAAISARNQLNLDEKEYVSDICVLLEDAGVKIHLLDSKLRSFFGLSVGESDGGPAIAININEAIPVERRIFSAAHEFGHLLLHAESYFTDEDSENDKQEKEANLFAGYFLMPFEAFKIVLHKSRGHHWVDRVIQIKRKFRVSYKTVLHRLIDMGVAKKGIYREFCRSYEQRYNKNLGYKEEPFECSASKAEPLMFVDADFIEDRLSRLVREAMEKDKISISRAAEILNLSLEEMRGWVRGWGKLNDK